MEGYKVSIIESSKELSAKERIKFKDTGDATKLDEAIEPDSTLIITPDAYIILGVHNEKSDNKDYKVYLIVDKSGNKYVTGSESFFTSFLDIWSEMAEVDEEYSIECYKLESKNYQGKYFLTCTIV